VCIANFDYFVQFVTNDEVIMTNSAFRILCLLLIFSFPTYARDIAGLNIDPFAILIGRNNPDDPILASIRESIVRRRPSAGTPDEILAEVDRDVDRFYAEIDYNLAFFPNTIEFYRHSDGKMRVRLYTAGKAREHVLINSWVAYQSSLRETRIVIGADGAIVEGPRFSSRNYVPPRPLIFGSKIIWVADEFGCIAVLDLEDPGEMRVHESSIRYPTNLELAKGNLIVSHCATIKLCYKVTISLK